MTSSTPPPTTTGHDPVGDIITGDAHAAGGSHQAHDPCADGIDSRATSTVAADDGVAVGDEADIPVVFYATNTPHNPIAAAGVKA